MQLLRHTPTKHYFIAIFAMVCTLFITFSIVIYKQHEEAARINTWSLYNYELIRQSRKLLGDLVDMETSVRGYLLSGEKRYMEPYENSLRTIPIQIAQLRILTRNDPSAQGTIDVWLERIEEFSNLLEEQVKNFDPNVSGTSQPMLERQKTEMDVLRALLENYIETRQQALEKQIYESRNKRASFKYILAIGTLLAITGTLFATLFILGLIKRSQKAEENVRAIESRFLTVMNGVNDGLYDFNMDEGTIYYSPAYKSMLGYTEDEHPNTLDAFNKTLHPDDHETTWQRVKDYQSGKIDAYTNVFRLRHKNGNWLWILSRGVGLRDSKGNINRLIGTHTDITEHKNREEELKRLNTDMETFTYITSHDLRAPLVNLRGFTREMEQSVNDIKPIIEKLSEKTKGPDKDKLKIALEQDIPESLRFIERSVEKMDTLTTAVLDLSRIGKREFRSEPVDTGAIVQRCLDTQNYEITQKAINVTKGELPYVMSDPLALEQVFSNLLDNAVKYLDKDRPGKISITAKEVDNYVIFTVEDNGRGIADADKEKIFQIFRRARNSSDVRGLGMGMTFVQATIRKLGGAIWFESTEGVGTKFHFRLPKNLKKEH